MADKDTIPATTAKTHLAEVRFVSGFLHMAVASDIWSKTYRDTSPPIHQGWRKPCVSQCTHRPTFPLCSETRPKKKQQRWCWVGWSFEQLSLGEGIPACHWWSGMKLLGWNEVTLKVLSTPTILWFYDLRITHLCHLLLMHILCHARYAQSISLKPGLKPTYVTNQALSQKLLLALTTVPTVVSSRDTTAQHCHKGSGSPRWSHALKSGWAHLAAVQAGQRHRKTGVAPTSPSVFLNSSCSVRSLSWTNFSPRTSDAFRLRQGACEYCLYISNGVYSPCF